ncbi:selenium cofactor biosynthesis protein YqeC [uncultured Pseudoflavonifractor sp.]|uniref:selenium cofactor biosynthesis protein YqeC n=1 Tax=uncultured Pseudoflavonifractor sp. TaxID=1221379 RepID=UPI0025DD2A46|nr:selenium cofactor biosynthesis protein YqeC [uncultured Pseudoflavonifractor sp.]
MRLWDKLGLDMDRHRVIALVGGGGKTTTMYALAREAREAGKTVIVTTTTHILPHPALFMTAESDPAALKELLDKYGIITVGKLDRKDKMTGGAVTACAAAADIVLAEADGARVRPLKAPAGHEPVIPAQAAAVLALAGMDCLGGTVEDICHRPEQVCALLGCGMDHVITPADVAAILSSPQGSRKGVGENMAFRCVLNKADTEARRRGAEEIAALLAERGIPAVITAYSREEQGGLSWFK